jgi:hypothetical protein
MTFETGRWLGGSGLAALLLVALLGSGCGDDGSEGGFQFCGPDEDLVDDDSDFITTEQEGFFDDDGDGIVNFFDLNSDGDGIDDIEEDDMDCTTAPRDTDGDGLPDFRDADGNGDGAVDDLTADRNEDGEPDYLQPDLDGDGIPNIEEIDLSGAAFDTDQDGTPDILDLDSDDDGVPDAAEGAGDADGDLTPNFRDLDSDGDGLSDTEETAEDGSPIFCDQEIDPGFDPEFEDEPMLDLDDVPDYLDRDSDNDGLTDGEESLFGTSLCNWDSDDDGQSDLVESVYERINCPDGPDAPGAFGCGCASDASCQIPPTDFFVVLPFEGRPVARTLTFESDALPADVMMLVSEDTRMDDRDFRTELPFRHFTRSFEDVVDSGEERLPDSWYGFATFNDLPFGLSTFNPPRFMRLTSPIQPPDAYTRDQFQTISNLPFSFSSSDSAGAHTEAIFQLLTDAFPTYRSGSTTLTLDPEGFPSCDEEATFGKACFRNTARPVIVQVAPNCAHAGPEGSSGACSFYNDVSPSPASWEDMIFQMTRRGARYVGVNAFPNRNQPRCGVGAPDADTSPCYYMFNTGLATGSTNEFGDALLIDHDFRDEAEDAVAAITDAVETVVRRAPVDVDTAVVDDPSDNVDATAFVRQRAPACAYDPVVDGGLPSPPCWSPPEGLDADEAVALVDQSTFFDILPGTQVSFDVVFQNLTVEGDDVARAYVGFVELRADRRTLISRRQLIVIVPAQAGPAVE